MTEYRYDVRLSKEEAAQYAFGFGMLYFALTFLATTLGAVSLHAGTVEDSDKYHNEFWAAVTGEREPFDDFTASVVSLLAANPSGEIGVPASTVSSSYQHYTVRHNFYLSGSLYMASPTFSERLELAQDFGLEAVQIEDPSSGRFMPDWLGLVMLASNPVSWVVMTGLSVSEINTGAILDTPKRKRREQKRDERRLQFLVKYPEYNHTDQQLIQVEEHVELGRADHATAKRVRERRLEFEMDLQAQIRADDKRLAAERVAAEQARTAAVNESLAQLGLDPVELQVANELSNIDAPGIVAGTDTDGSGDCWDSSDSGDSGDSGCD